MQIGSNQQAFSMAQMGMQAGFNQLNQSSETLANPNETDKAEALIETKQAENLVSANLKAAKAADDNIGTLLDIMA